MSTHDKSDPTLVSCRLNKGLIGHPGSRVELHGLDYVSWTRLARTAWSGVDRLFLQEAVNWQPGHKVGWGG